MDIIISECCNTRLKLLCARHRLGTYVSHVGLFDINLDIVNIFIQLFSNQDEKIGKESKQSQIVGLVTQLIILMFTYLVF